MVIIIDMHKIFKFDNCMHTAAAKQQQNESFRLVYSLDMTLPNQSCPDALQPRTVDSQQLCGKKVGFWPSHIAVPVNGQSYQQVRGKVTAYQYGKVDTFYPSVIVYREGNEGIDGTYVDGVSITHGQAPRRHIWTYAIGVSGRGGGPCPRSGGAQPPEFVGQSYFCSTGTPASDFQAVRQFYPIRLWSNLLGNCPENDLYFCVILPEPTTDDLEIRVLADEPLSNEDVYIESIELYIR